MFKTFFDALLNLNEKFMKLVFLIIFVMFMDLFMITFLSVLRGKGVEIPIFSIVSMELHSYMNDIACLCDLVV